MNLERKLKRINKTLPRFEALKVKNDIECFSVNKQYLNNEVNLQPYYYWRISEFCEFIECEEQEIKKLIPLIIEQCINMKEDIAPHPLTGETLLSRYGCYLILSNMKEKNEKMVKTMKYFDKLTSLILISIDHVGTPFDIDKLTMNFTYRYIFNNSNKGYRQ